MKIIGDIMRPKVNVDKIPKEIKEVNSKNINNNIINIIFDINIFFLEVVEYKTIAVLLENSSEIISHDIMIVVIL